LALVVGVIGTTIGMAKATRAEAEARQHALKAEQAAAAERKANELLQSLFTGLDPRVVRMGVLDVMANFFHSSTRRRPAGARPAGTGDAGPAAICVGAGLFRYG